MSCAKGRPKRNRTRPLASWDLQKETLDEKAMLGMDRNVEVVGISWSGICSYQPKHKWVVHLPQNAEVGAQHLLLWLLGTVKFRVTQHFWCLTPARDIGQFCFWRDESITSYVCTKRFLLPSSTVPPPETKNALEDPVKFMGSCSLNPSFSLGFKHEPPLGKYSALFWSDVSPAGL